MLASRHLIFTGRMLFLTFNEQCQSTEGNFVSPHIYVQKQSAFTLTLSFIQDVLTHDVLKR